MEIPSDSQRKSYPLRQNLGLVNPMNQKFFRGKIRVDMLKGRDESVLVTKKNEKGEEEHSRNQDDNGKDRE